MNLVYDHEFKLCVILQWMFHFHKNLNSNCIFIKTYQPFRFDSNHFQKWSDVRKRKSSFLSFSIAKMSFSLGFDLQIAINNKNNKWRTLPFKCNYTSGRRFNLQNQVKQKPNKKKVLMKLARILRGKHTPSPLRNEKKKTRVYGVFLVSFCLCRLQL